MVTRWPARASAPASAVPTLPAPMIAISMIVDPPEVAGPLVRCRHFVAGATIPPCYTPVNTTLTRANTRDDSGISSGDRSITAAGRATGPSLADGARPDPHAGRGAERAERGVPVADRERQGISVVGGARADR